MTSKVVLPAISRAVVVPASDNPDGDDGNDPSPPPQCLGPHPVLGAAFEVDQDIGGSGGPPELASALSNSAEQIKVGEVGMILRSDKSWKYAKLLRRTDSEMEFIVDIHGTREIVLKAYYGNIRRIPPTEEGELDDGNEPGAASEFLLTLQQSKKENGRLKKGIVSVGLLYLITLFVLFTMHLTYPKYPTQAPTLSPTKAPTLSPTKAPTLGPTKAPTLSPTKAPTLSPTQAPTYAEALNEWDSTSPLISKKIFELDLHPTVWLNVGATKIQNGWANCLWTNRVMESGKHRISLKLMKGEAGNLFGLVRDGVAWDKDLSSSTSTDAWCMGSYDGSLYGNGKGGDDGAGQIKGGQIVSMEADLDNGTLRFWVDGKPHGPGRSSGVTGRLRWAVGLYHKDSAVQIVLTPELQP